MLNEPLLHALALPAASLRERDVKVWAAVHPKQIGGGVSVDSGTENTFFLPPGGPSFARRSPTAVALVDELRNRRVGARASGELDEIEAALEQLAVELDDQPKLFTGVTCAIDGGCVTAGVDGLLEIVE